MGVTCVRAAIFGAAQIFISVLWSFVDDHIGRTASRLNKSNKRETCVLYEAHKSLPPLDLLDIALKAYNK